MTADFNDLSLDRFERVSVKLPKKFGSSDATGSVVQLATNNQLGKSSLYLELYDKKGSAGVVTKVTANNFLNYIEKRRYDHSIFHRSVPGFVLQSGGYLAPLAPADEGGTVDPISTFKTIKNQPGNSNLRGTIAMAKRAGDPDSATSQWFVNLGDNLELDTQNEGFTVFGEVLGRGMKVVDQLASAEIYNFGASFGELPLWELKRSDDNSVVVAPDDFLIINSARKLKTKKRVNVNLNGDKLFKIKIK